MWMLGVWLRQRVQANGRGRPLPPPACEAAARVAQRRASPKEAPAPSTRGCLAERRHRLPQASSSRSWRGV